jgi:hypothetical protein
MVDQEDTPTKAKIRNALMSERRLYTCSVCGVQRVIEVRLIEKQVLVCVHKDTRGGELPVIQMREEGHLLVD